MFLIVGHAVASLKFDLKVCLDEEPLRNGGVGLKNSGGFEPLMRNGDPARVLDINRQPLRVVEMIGAGTFGVVIRVKDPMGVHRALKIFLPPESLRSSGIIVQMPAGMDSPTDYDEITLTNRHPFKHIISVAHHGDVTGESPPREVPEEVAVGPGALAVSPGTKLPFTITPLVDGMPMHGFFNAITEPVRSALAARPASLQALHDHVLSLYRDVLSGLVELSDADIVHMDIKGDNIMVFTPNPHLRPLTRGLNEVDFISTISDPATRLKAFLVDLGISRCVPPDRPGPIGIATVPDSFPRNLMRSLEEDPERPGFVSATRLREYGPGIDLGMFGRVVCSHLLNRCDMNPRGPAVYPDAYRQNEAAKVSFWKHVFSDDYDVITGMARELLAPDIPKGVDPREFLRRLQTVPLYSDKDIYASSILTDRHPKAKIRSGEVLARLGEPLDQVVDHPQFQRLRRIAQLAYVSEVFPEATHTRFSHSLRTFELTKEAIRFLTPKSLFRLIFTRRDVDHLLSAALIHDIGQYPFAHIIEDLRELGDQLENPSLQTIRHDHELVKQLITDKEHLNRRGQTIADIFTSHGFSVDDILFCIQKNPPAQKIRPALRVSHDLIAKVVDLDRIAYLIQDSERSGVPYGKAIDVESFLDALTIAGSYDDLANAPENLQLALEDSGVSAAEAVLAAVYWMYRNVYWRHTNRAFMSMVKTVMKELILKRKLTFDEYWKATNHQGEAKALEFLRNKYEQCKDIGALNPLDSIWNLNRLGYARLVTAQPRHAASAALHKRIRTSLTTDSEERVSEIVCRYLKSIGLNVRKGAVLTDIPLRSHHRETASLPIIGEHHLSKRRREESIDLLEYSRLASRLNRLGSSGHARMRIFLAREVAEQMSATNKQEIEDGIFDYVLGELNKSLPKSSAEPDTPQPGE